MAAFGADINFQPAGVPIPTGYKADTGGAFASRNGLQYGWNGSNFNAKDRNSSKSPDQRYDTFNLLKPSGAGSIWELAVPNGWYTVTVVAGDPTAFDSVDKVNVEGVLTVNGTPTSANHWVSGTKTVNVTDGRLTLKPATGAKNVKLDFVRVASAKATLAGLTLVDASTDVDIGALSAGRTIDLYPTGSFLNVRANASGNVASVAFKLDGKAIRTDSAAIFTLATETAGDYAAWTPAVGSHTLVAMPYSGPNATGAAGPAVTVSFKVTNTAPTGSTLADKVARALVHAQNRLKLSLTELNGATSQFARLNDPVTGKWVPSSADDWASGMLAGSLWAMYGETGDAFWKDKATASALGIKSKAGIADDAGFRIYNSFAPLLAATGGTGTNGIAARDALLKAAAAKSATFNAKVGAFQSAPWLKSRSGNPRANFGVLMDMTMDLELMFWAARTTGNQTYYDQAISHARVVATHHVRADGGSFQWCYFDAATGDFIDGEKGQGYTNDSTWSRGQAWGIHAFTMIYRETGLPEFLTVAERMADYFVSRLPADHVPYWDFDVPVTATTFKDSSAAAIAASGLFELGRLTSGATSDKYWNAAQDILGTLASTPYLSVGTNSRGILNRGAAFVPPPGNLPQTSTSWGDFYFMQAIGRFRAGR